MTTWQIILVSIVLLIVGLVRQLHVLRKKAIRLDLATEFLNKFIDWYNGEAKDCTLHNWLLNKSEAVQTMLASRGLVSLRRPFESGYHLDTPIILNAIPEIRRAWCGWNDTQTIQTYAQLVDNCLRRFIGLTEEQLRRERVRLLNPIVLFCGGVAWLMELPLAILNETKIISTSQRAIIASGRVFSLLSGVVTLATLVATVMSIAMGWANFRAVIIGWMK